MTTCIRGDCAAPMAGWLERLPFCREHLRLLAGRLAEARKTHDLEAKAGPRPPRRGLFRRKGGWLW
jgi:hypothetical protein